MTKQASGLTNGTVTALCAARRQDMVGGEQEMFGDSLSALTWATEVMRVRRFPKIPSVYSGMARPDVIASGGMPVGADTYAQALTVYQCVYKLSPAEQEILQLHVWGDFATPVRLDGALKLQEAWRQKGKRVRLSYRYSQRQLGTILGMSKSHAGRTLNAALRALADELLAAGVIV